MHSQTLVAQLESFQATSAMIKQGPHLHPSWHFEYILLLGFLFCLPHLAGLSHTTVKPSQVSLAITNWRGKTDAQTSFYPWTDKLWQPDTKNCQKNLPQVQVNKRKIIHEWWLHHEMIKQEKDGPGRAKSQSTLGLADMYKHRQRCRSNSYCQHIFL